MRYRQRVTIQRKQEIRSTKGAVSFDYTDVEGLIDLPATIVPSTVEQRAPGHTIIQDRYDVVIAGRRTGIQAKDAVVDAGGRTFEIESIDPQVGERQTRLTARLVTGPVAAAAGS